MATTSKKRSVDVLLAEGNPDDVQRTTDTLKDSHHQVNLIVAEDGEVAMEHLLRAGEHVDSPRPDLVLLSLQLSEKPCEEVLAEINDNDELTGIPVIMLTGTSAEQSLMQSYGILPSRSWMKPIDLDLFDNAVSKLDSLAAHPISMSMVGSSETQGEEKRWWWPFS